VTRLRLGLFLALCGVQLAIPLAMAYRYERARREGTLYRFHVEPFDPVDAFRGRYVAIRLTLTTDAFIPREGEEVYVLLQRDTDGFASVHTLSADRPKMGDWLVGTVGSHLWGDGGESAPRRPRGTRIELPFDRYYMEEGKAPQAERATRPFGPGIGPQMDVTARVRVRHGLGAIEGLDVNGVPIERWLATVPPGP
jgi:uncharacterized membrane-anchored protein